MNKRRRKSVANHVDWISLDYGDIMHCSDFWCRSAHISYTDTPTTQVTVSFKSRRNIF